MPRPANPLGLQENDMATEATEAAGHGGEAVGMPQLDFSTWPNQIFWLLVTLAVIYFLLTRIALPRIGSVLADRKGAITSDLAAAEELKQKALKAEKYWEINTRLKVVFAWKTFVKKMKAEREEERRQREAEEQMLKRAIAERWRQELSIYFREKKKIKLKN